MGRKNLFLESPEEKLTAVNSASEPTATRLQEATPHLGMIGSRGAIGAVTRSIEKLKEQSIAELRPDLIDASFIIDRLETDATSHAELVASIREHGQQVPILVRPHPERAGRYQIAYGRRRLRALTELGRPVRAIIKTLSDQQLVVAQGQENSARTDLSFIEKALFAAKLEEGGFDRETIMAALSVDKTTLSRLISSAKKVPRDILEAIGPAPKAGRDRWIELATRLENVAQETGARKAIGQGDFAGKSSDERFVYILAAATPKREKAPQPAFVRDAQGARIAQVKVGQKSVTLSIDKQTQGPFAQYLAEHIGTIYEAFRRDPPSEQA